MKDVAAPPNMRQRTHLLNSRKPRLAETVVLELKSEILSGAMALGQKLPTEAGLAGRFGVSRTVIREAISALRSDDLVVSVQGKGIFVTSELPTASIWRPPGERRDIPRLLDIFEFRLAWEAEAAALAAIRRSATQDYAIRAAHQRVLQAIENDLFPHHGNYEFHLAVAQATGNAIYVEAIDRFGPHVTPVALFRNLAPGQGARYMDTVVREHAAVVEAISAGDAEAARHAMREHIRLSLARFQVEVHEDSSALPAAAVPGD